MSADTITGVLVLQPYENNQDVFHLFFQYTRADGIIGYSHIPMKRKGTPAPAGWQGPLWDFVEQSPELECSPSVRILGPRDGERDHFHNQGLWRNPYVVMAYPFMDREPDGGAVCRSINRWSTKEERDGVIFEGRAKGIIK